MRYLIDTNIFVFLATDISRISRDVRELMEDYSNTFYLSTESVRELIVGFKNKGLYSKTWKTAEDMVRSIQRDFHLILLPVKEEHLITFANLQYNINQGHNDPSDFIIISQAITNKMPLISSDTLFPFYKKQGLDFVFNDKTEGKGRLRR